MEWRDRKGRPISGEEMREICTEGKRRVGRTELPDGRVVSTVLLGLTHRCMQEGCGCYEAIYETMVFNEEGTGGDEWRWHDLKEAIDGHAQVVRQLGGGQ